MVEGETGMQESGLSVATKQAPASPASYPLYGTGRPPGLLMQTFAVALAMVGGLLGVPGAIFQELSSGFALLSSPLIEEALKPMGVYLLLLCWPRAIRNCGQAAALSALGGLIFGLIEALLYVTLYNPHAGASFALYRFSVGVPMHVLCSFVMGSGLDRGLIHWAAGRAPFPRHTAQRYGQAAAIHMGFNVLAALLYLVGVLRF
jgi:hypothetical protein